MSSGVAPPCAWPWMWKQPRLLHSLTSRLVRLTPSTPFSRSVATESVAICGEEAAGDERLVERLGWQVEEASLCVPPLLHPRHLETAPHTPEPCLQATLPLEFHAVQILQRKLRVGARRDAACDTPEPPEAPPDSAHEAEGWGSMCSEAVCCEGRHTSCCMVLCAKERKVDPSPGPGP